MVENGCIEATFTRLVYSEGAEIIATMLASSK